MGKSVARKSTSQNLAETAGPEDAGVSRTDEPAATVAQNAERNTAMTVEVSENTLKRLAEIDAAEKVRETQQLFKELETTAHAAESAPMKLKTDIRTCDHSGIEHDYKFAANHAFNALRDLHTAYYLRHQDVRDRLRAALKDLRDAVIAADQKAQKWERIRPPYRDPNQKTTWNLLEDLVLDAQWHLSKLSELQRDHSNFANDLRFFEAEVTDVCVRQSRQLPHADREAFLVREYERLDAKLDGIVDAIRTWECPEDLPRKVRERLHWHNYVMG
jgi:hypothetical protein